MNVTMGNGDERKNPIKGEGNSDLEDVFKCMIDLEPLKKPKLLSCGHTFCEGCLQRLMQSTTFFTSNLTCPETQDSTSIICPTCKAKTPIPRGGVKDLPNNLTISKIRSCLGPSSTSTAGISWLQDYLQSEDQPQTCDSCVTHKQPGADVGEARYFCYRCSENFCQKCYETHQIKLKEHTEVVDLASETSQVFNFFCHSHGRYMSFFCQDCKRALCTSCRMHEHDAEHVIVDISDKDAISEKQLELRELKPFVESCLEEVKMRTRKMGDLHQKVYDIYADHESSLKKYFHQLKNETLKKLDDWFNSMNDERTQRRRETEKHLNAIQEDLNFHTSSYYSLLDYVDCLLSNKAGFHPLSRYSDLVTRMNTVRRSIYDLQHVQILNACTLTTANPEEFLTSLDCPANWTDTDMVVNIEEGNMSVDVVDKMEPSTSTPKINRKHPPTIRISEKINHSASTTTIDDSSDFLVPNIPPMKYNTSPDKDGTLSPQHTENSLGNSFEQLRISRSHLDSTSSNKSDGEWSDWSGSASNISSGQVSPNTSISAVIMRRAISENHLLRQSHEFSRDVPERSSDGTQRARYVKHESVTSKHKKTKFRIFKKILSKPKPTKYANPPPLETPGPTYPSPPQQPPLSYSPCWQRAGGGQQTSGVAYMTDVSYCREMEMWVVADNSESKITFYDEKGQQCMEPYSEPSEGFRPWGVAAVQNNGFSYAYSTDTHNKCIRICPLGFNEPVVKFGKGIFSSPHGICYFADIGRIVVSDLSVSEPKLCVFDLSGRFINKITSLYGANSSQLKWPWYIAAGTNKRVFVSDRDNSCIKVFDIQSGQFITQSKRKIGCPAGITMDCRENIVVADRSGNHNVVGFNQEGQFLKNVSIKCDQFSWPQAIASDHVGQIVVTEYLEHTLGTLKSYICGT